MFNARAVLFELEVFVLVSFVSVATLINGSSNRYTVSTIRLCSESNLGKMCTSMDVTVIKYT